MTKRRQARKVGHASVLSLCCLVAVEAREAARPQQITRKELFELLTRTSWCDRERAGEPRPLFGDFTDWELRADGSYHWVLSTDYTPSPGGSGRWTLEQVDGEWVAMLSTGERHRVSVDADGVLTLGLMRFRPCRPLPVGSPYSTTSLPPVQIPSRVAALITGLTGGEWHRTNDLDLNFRPTSVRFNRDWSYVSIYRGGECENRGAWYATSKEIHASAPTNPCDLRDPRYSESMAADLLPDDRLVFSSREPYLRKEAMTTGRGILWLVYGPQELEAWIEYDMPIRRGANTFTLHVRNHDWEPRGARHLRRFVVSLDHVREYRDAAGRVHAAASELVGIDLEGTVVKAGAERSVSFEVVFTQALRQWVYFDLIVDGETQAWDVRQSHFLWMNQ
jgi:hypothetical protein